MSLNADTCVFWRKLSVASLCAWSGYAEVMCDCFGLYGQVTKRTRWMPWQPEAMKDVVACDKLRGGGK